MKQIIISIIQYPDQVNIHTAKLLVHAPDIVSEEDEPTDIKQNSAKEKHSIGPTQALAATLNRHQGKERNSQID